MERINMNAQPGTATQGYKRNLRNYVLDKRFQLKFTSYVLGLTILVAGFLGVFLWSTTHRLLLQAEVAVDARSLAAEKSKELGNVILSNELLHKMNDDSFEEQFKKRSADIDAEYEVEKQAIIEARAQLLRQQKWALGGLVGALLAFIVFVGIAGILATHRIVGPLFRMRKLSQELATGKFPAPPHGLRPHDEMKETFEAFTLMVQNLRQNQGAVLNSVSQIIALAERQSVNDSVLQEMRALESRLKSTLE